MGNAGVKVTISAVDRASQTLEHINAKLAAMQAPVRRVHAAVERFSNTMGLTRLQSGVINVTLAGLGMFQSLSQIVPVLGTIIGATTVAGIYKLASAWGQFGTNLRTAANSIGMAPSRLMAMQNAARLSGGSADAMSSALQGLSQTRWEAMHGFAPEAIVQFKALGISLQELQHLKPDQMFERVAKRLRAIRDPAAKVIAATQVFGGAAQGLMPILQQTEAQYQANIEAARKHGLLNQDAIAAADRLRHAQTDLTEAVEGFGNSLAQSVEPALRPAVEQMTNWIDANRKWIAQDIGGYVRQLATWLRNGGWKEVGTDIVAIYNRVQDVVHALGGWKTVAVAVATGMTTLFAAPILAGLGMLVTSLGSIAAGFAAIGVAVGTAVTAYKAWEALHTSGKGALIEHYVDKYLPNASFWDDKLSRLGIGKSYSEQASYSDWLKQPRGMRNNNPGNLLFAGQSGATLEKGTLLPKFAAFPTMDAGIQALRAQLLRYGTRGDDTISSILAHYAPPNENDTARYEGFLASRLHIGPHDHLALQDPNVMRAMVEGITSMEVGPGTLSPSVINHGLQAAVMPSPSSSSQGAAQPQNLRVEIDHRNAPPGAFVRVKSTSPGLKVHAISQHRAMHPALTAVGN
ncbi:MAG: phage tail protein [Gluconobacter cerinus]|uniref:phage tail protein n=1 Tax=Gluconobacter cerinus TaxID=38307 RepID=UPI0039EA59C3